MFELEGKASEGGLVAVAPEAHSHLASVSIEARRSNGLVYTPTPLVDFILEEAEAGLTELPSPILDPACGCGVFLTGVVERLAYRLSQGGVDLAKPEGRAQLLSSARERIFGVDVDEGAVQIARRALADAVSTATASDVPPSVFERNIRVSDFLLSETGVPNERFGLVIGNPPYVTTSRLQPEQKGRLRNRYETAHGRMDLYVLFMERSIELLRPGGRFSLITPDKYLSSVSAQRLRELLTRAGSVLRISRFASHEVFEHAATVPSVTVWERGRTRSQVLVQSCYVDRHTGSVRTTDSFVVPRSRLVSKQWNVQRPIVHDLLNELVSGHRTLRSCATRISAGTATGLNDAFLVREGSLAEIEPELLRPTVRGRDVDARCIAPPGMSILVPYRFDADEPCLVDLSNYPGAKAWLEQWRQRLEERHCVRAWGKAWYDLHDPVPCDLAKQPKILVPDVARHNRFAFDSGHLWPMHSLYYISVDGISPIVLTEVLNSPAVEFLIRARAPRVKDGFSRYRRQFLLDLPVPTVDKKTSILIERALVEDDPAEARALVLELFGVTEDRIVDALSELDGAKPREAT